jgi:hypothetical protein
VPILSPSPRARVASRPLVRGALARACATALASSAGAATAPPLPEEKPGRTGETGIGVWMGGGWYDNEDFNLALDQFGFERIESGFEYGLIVRHRMSRWVSLGVDLLRLDGRSTLDDGEEFAILGSPLVVNLTGHPVSGGPVAVSVFGGAGLLVGGTVRLATPTGEVEASQTGFYVHGGAEIEGRIGPNLSFALRGLVRKTRAENIDFREVTGDPTAVFDVDFDGAAIHFGPRWYFGGTPAAPEDAQSR